MPFIWSKWLEASWIEVETKFGLIMICLDFKSLLISSEMSSIDFLIFSLLSFPLIKETVIFQYLLFLTPSTSGGGIHTPTPLSRGDVLYPLMGKDGKYHKKIRIA